MTRNVVLVLAAIVAIIGIVTMISSAKVVERGHVGVYDLFGQVKDEEMAPGFYFVNPFAHIEKVNIQTQEYEYKTIKGTLTKEGLEVVLDVSIIWNIDPIKASDIYKTVKGDYFVTLITANFMGITRDEIKRWTAEDIYTGKSTEVQSDVQNKLTAVLAGRGINIEAVLFRGMDLPPKLTAAIAMKLEEKQAIDRKDFELTKQGLEAKRILVEAGATASANKLISQSITPELINWQFVQNLKGNDNVIYVPMGGQGQGGIILSPPVKK